METLIQWVVAHAPELVVGALVVVGLPLLVRALRRVGKAKLTDQDKSNDWQGHLANDVADLAERKALEEANKKKVKKY